MDADLDTFATVLYVFTDDLLKAHPRTSSAMSAGWDRSKTSDAELLTSAMLQALLGYPSERRGLRYARAHLLGMFPTLPASWATTSGCASWPTR